MVSTISVIGLGKLGSPIAACVAARGFQVIAVDIDAQKVDAIGRGVPPVHEPGLAELLQESKGRLLATQDTETAVRDSQATFIVVSTPSEADGGFSLRHAILTCAAIGRALRNKDSYHLVVLTSTVMPGSINAEITKLAVNTYITTNISHVNMLDRLLEKLPEADVSVVTYALSLDSRIGSKYLKGAVSYGGPCSPRHNRAFAALAARSGAFTDLAEATDRFNRAQIAALAGLVKSHQSGSLPVGILGLTYKPNTAVIEESFGLLLALELASANLPIVVFDPSADLARAFAAHKSVRVAASAEDCIAQSGIVVLATPWQQFCDLASSAWMQPFRSGPSFHATRRVVIDCWRALPHLEGSQNVHYIRLGAPSPAPHTATASISAD